MPIDDIEVGTSVRDDPTANLESLKESIRRFDLLQLPLVTEDCRLVAGRRRLEALRVLGRTTTQVRVVKNLGDGFLLARQDENAERLNLTPREKLRLAEMIESALRAEAKDRQRRGGKREGAGNAHTSGR